MKNQLRSTVSAIVSLVIFTLVCIALLCYNEPAHADGTGVLVSNNGDILTDEHVVHDQLNNLGVHFSVTVNGVRYPAIVVTHGTSKDLALVHILKQTTCLAISTMPTEVGNIVSILRFNPINGQASPYAVKSLDRGFLKAVEVPYAANLSSPAELMNEINIQTYPGNSGSPILNLSNDIIGMLSRNSIGTLSVIVTEDNLNDFKHENPQVQCKNPNYSDIYSNIVWIWETT